MRELSLFSGAGGGLYASILLGWRTICAVEIDPYRRAVLLARQRDGIFPRFAIWGDVRTFPAELFRGRVDVVSGGFPCQGWSAAGKRLGERDPRNLWPETAGVVARVRPQFVFFENVPPLASSPYFHGVILGELEALGFAVAWTILRASDVGAPHRRARLWIAGVRIADADSDELRLERRRRKARTRTASAGADDEAGSLADAGCWHGDSRPLWMDQRWQARASTELRGEILADASFHRRESRWPGDSAEEPGRWESDGGGIGASVADAESERADAAQFAGFRRGAEPSDPLSADPDDSGSQGHGGQHLCRDGACERTPWACSRAVEDERLARSGIRRVSDGVADRLQRLGALGDGQVPIVAATAFRLLVGRLT